MIFIFIFLPAERGCARQKKIVRNLWNFLVLFKISQADRNVVEGKFTAALRTIVNSICFQFSRDGGKEGRWILIHFPSN